MRIRRRIRMRSRRLKDGRWSQTNWTQLLLPLPSKHRAELEKYLSRDLEVQVEPFNHGFAILVHPRGRSSLDQLSQRFRALLADLELPS